MGQKEMGEQSTLPVVARHGADRLPSVEVDSYNVELKDNEGFIAPVAVRSALWSIKFANQFAKAAMIR